MYHVTKIAAIIIEKGIKLTDEQLKIFLEKGYYIEEINYYVSKKIKILDKEKIRHADIVFVLYKNKISTFSQNIIKYAAQFHKKIIAKSDIESTDL